MVKKLSGCKKISIIQNLFRAELQNGVIPVNNIDSKVITQKFNQAVLAAAKVY